MTPMTALRWIIGLNDWVQLGVSVAVWVVTAGLIIRAWESDPRRTTAGEAWFVALFGGFLAGLTWPFLLCFGVPAALGLGGIWGLAFLVAHPPTLRARRRAAGPHWADALPPDLTLDQIVKEAERRAMEGDQ